MSIVASEIIWRKSATNDDTSSNGGRMTPTVIADDVKNNLWPDVSQAERASGSTKHRKAHCHIANDADLQMLETRVFVEKFTPGDDAVTIFSGDTKDTQATVSGAEQQYGCGQLNANAIAAATTVDVLTEAAALDYFKNGMLVRVSDKLNVDDAGGNAEYVTLTADATYASDVATLVFAGDPLINGYTAAATRVASVIEVGTVESAHGTVTYTPTAGGTGTFNPTYLTTDSIGTIEQNWTLEFTTATAFNIVGDTVGAQGSGSTSGGASPTNSDYSKPYFVITSSAFGGAYEAGDTLTFTTTPATIPLWLKRTIPVAASSLSANKVYIAVDGESA